MKLALCFSLLFALHAEQGREVWICVSESSTAYHLNVNCQGLKRCKHDIIKVSESEAKSTYKRELCGYED